MTFDIREYILEQNDARSQLSEVRWTLEWYDRKKEKWSDRYFSSESEAKNAEDKARARLKAKGDRNPKHVVLHTGKRSSTYTD